MLYAVVSGHMEGSTDSAYLHGIFSSKEKAEEIAKDIENARILEVEIDELQVGDSENDYNGRPGIRLV